MSVNKLGVSLYVNYETFMQQISLEDCTALSVSALQ